MGLVTALAVEVVSFDVVSSVDTSVAADDAETQDDWSLDPPLPAGDIVNVFEVILGPEVVPDDDRVGEFRLAISFSSRSIFSSLGNGFSPWLGLFSDRVSMDSMPESSPC